jgi:hypothetical protein
MWTKNVKFMPGTDSRIVGFSAAKAGSGSAIASRPAVATRRVMRMKKASLLEPTNPT